MALGVLALLADIDDIRAGLHKGAYLGHMDLTELALEHIDGNERRLIDGVLCRAVDRRIAQRHVLEVIDGKMHADHCRDDIHAADNVALPVRPRAKDQACGRSKIIQGHIVPIRHNADLIAREDRRCPRRGRSGRIP